MQKPFHYGIDKLTVGICMDIANGLVKAILSPKAIEQVQQSKAYVEEIVASRQTVYGINTGFGSLCDTQISAADTRQLQHNLLQSHSVGVGNPIPTIVAKLMLITKVHALAQGYSGVSLATLERIIWHIEQDIIPVVPEKGSVGASGDLAPLSHLFLPLIGLGKVWVDGVQKETDAVLQAHQLSPIALGPKEGLALINGTQFILSFAVAAVAKMHQALETADIIGAMSLEGLMGSARPFDPRLHQLRPFAGCIRVAERLSILLKISHWGTWSAPIS